MQNRKIEGAQQNLPRISPHISIFLLMIVVTLPLQAQRRNKVHVIEDIEVERQIDEALEQQWDLSDREVVAQYLRILQSTEGAAMRFRPLELEEMQTVQKILEFYRRGEFSFQKFLDNPPDEGGYLMEVLDRFPENLISMSELKRLSDLYVEGGMTEVWRRFNQRFAPGHYLGTREYLKRILGKFPGDPLHSPISSDVENASRLLWRHSRPQSWIELIDGYPSWPKRAYALDVLGNYHFLRGEMDLALGSWKRLLQLYPVPKGVSRWQILAQIATAAYIMGDMEIYDRIRELGETAPVSFEGKEIAFSQYVENISKNFAGVPTMENVLYYGGNGSHSALSLSFPISDAKRVVDKKKISYTFSSRKTRRFSREEMIPLVSGNRLYYKTKNRIICFHLLARRTLWSRSYTPPSWSNRIKSSVHHLTAAIAHGCLFFFGSHPTKRNSYNNTLYVRDKNTGKLLATWSPTAEGDQFNHTNFLFAPVVVGDRLFASATTITGQTNTEVFCFDISALARYSRQKRTAPGASIAPELLWRRFVCSSVERNLDGSDRDHTNGLGIASGYGMVYCCSNLGVVAALDIYSGEIRWLAKYHDHFPREYRFAPQNEKRRNHFWRGLPPIVKNGKLYVAPGDAGKLYIYDCFTGSLLRTFPEEGSVRKIDHVIGVDSHGVVYLAGPKTYSTTQVLALAPPFSPSKRVDKEILWKTGISGKMFGNALLTKRWIYLITRRGVTQIDITNGKKREMIEIVYRNKHYPRQPGRPAVQFQPHSILTAAAHGRQYLILSGDSLAVFESASDN